MYPDYSVQRQVLLVQEQFWQALKTRDASLLATILAPAFVGRSPGEADQTREEFIATLTSFPVVVSEVAGEAIEVHVFGTVAILTGVQVARLELPGGKEKMSRVMLNNVFCQEDPVWCMVLCHSFEIVQDL